MCVPMDALEFDQIGQMRWENLESKSLVSISPT